jgi:DNA repair protein RadC
MEDHRTSEDPPVSVQQRARIKDWPVDERPREKLLKRGVQALSDAELLAIILRTGTGQSTALDLARRIVADHGTLRRLASRSPQELMRTRGVGKAKAVELIAAFELGRRMQGDPEERRIILRSPEDVARLMIPRLRDQTRELFYVLVLDSQNGLVQEVELTAGTLNASLVHPREVFKAAIDHRAASIIVVHNHPSGNTEPSKEDIQITRQLAEAGKIVDIPVHDHVIVAGSGHVSLAERGYL